MLDLVKIVADAVRKADDRIPNVGVSPLAFKAAVDRHYEKLAAAAILATLNEFTRPFVLKDADAFPYVAPTAKAAALEVFTKNGRRLKVFAGTVDGRHRVIMATTSITAFYKATRITRGYAMETGNETELKVAFAAPGKLFYTRDGANVSSRTYHRVRDARSIPHASTSK